MSDIKTWMPMYWGDYRAKTLRLSLAEHGAYLLLIGAYWMEGRPLPDDDRQLMRIIGASPAEWRKIRPALMPFFDIRDGHWYHVRVEEEIATAQDNVERAKKRTQAATEARNKRRDEERNVQRNVRRNDDPRTGEGEGTLPEEEVSLASVDGTDPSWEAGND